MAVVGQLMVQLVGNHAPLMASIAQSEGAMKGFGGRSSAILGALKAAAIGAGVATGVGLAIGVKAAADFQEQLAKVNTIAHLTPDALSGIGRELQTLSAKTGIALPELSQGLYDALSVGVPLKNAMAFVSDATDLAIGGLSTVPEAIRSITTATNAWGTASGSANLTLADSAKVMDILASAIAAGDATAAMLPGALGNVASTAAMMNVPLEVAAATMATLSTRGQSVDEGATALSAFLEALMAVPPGMQELQDKTRKSYEQIARTKGPQAAMQALVTDAEKYGVAMKNVLGRKEALPLVGAFTGPGALVYQANLASAYDSTGMASAQAAERMDTFERQMMRLGTAANNLAITVGTPLLDHLTSFVEGVNAGIQAVAGWVTSGQNLAGTFAPVVNAIVAKVQEMLPVLVSIGDTVMDLATRVWEGGLNKALQTGATVIGSVVDVLGGLATAITTNEDVMNILRTVADLIGKGFGIASDAVNNLLTFLGDLGDAIRNNEVLMQSLADIGDGIAAGFVAAGPAIDAVISAIGRVVELAGIAFDQILKLAGGTSTPAGIGDEGIGRRTPQVDFYKWDPSNPDTDPIFGGLNRFVGGAGDWIFRGGRPEGAPVQLQVPIVVNIDGQKVTEVVERRQYNNASQYNSGFNGGELP